jgi:hypothetical protein
LWHEWSEKRQTYKNLAEDFHMSQKTVRRKLDSYEVPNISSVPTSIILLIDTTYFGSDLGIMAFKEAQGKKILKVKLVEHESAHMYHEGVRELEEE